MLKVSQKIDCIQVKVNWFSNPIFIEWANYEGSGARWCHGQAQLDVVNSSEKILPEYPPDLLMTVENWGIDEDGEIYWEGSDHDIPSPFYEEIGKFLVENYQPNRMILLWIRPDDI